MPSRTALPPLQRSSRMECSHNITGSEPHASPSGTQSPADRRHCGKEDEAGPAPPRSQHVQQQRQRQYSLFQTPPPPPPLPRMMVSHVPVSNLQPNKRRALSTSTLALALRKNRTSRTATTTPLLKSAILIVFAILMASTEPGGAVLRECAASTIPSIRNTPNTKKRMATSAKTLIRAANNNNNNKMTNLPERHFPVSLSRIRSLLLFQRKNAVATAATGVVPGKSNINKKVSPPFASSSSSPSPPPPPNNMRLLLWLIRLLFLFYYASLGSLLPYLPVYYNSLGHSGPMIGVLGAVKPLTTFLVAPAWGLLSDAVFNDNPFAILQITFVVSLIGQLAVAISSNVTYILRMVFITAVFNAPVKSLLDSMAMSVLPPSQVADYGRLRLWGQLGFGLGSSGVGLLLSKSSATSVIPWPMNVKYLTEATLTALPLQWMKSSAIWMDKFWQSMASYRMLFVVHAALSLPTWLCIQAFGRMERQKAKANSSERQSLPAKIKTNKKPSPTMRAVTSVAKNESTPKKSGVLDGLLLLLQDSNAMLFFFLIFVTGTSSGVIENFAYVRIREVGGTGQEMGLSRLVSSLAGAPMFWYSGRVSQALGADRVLVLSLISYVVRFVLYAVMRNAYHGLPAEALRGVTFAAFWSTSTIYAHKISPPGLSATMLMFLNAMYGGLGQSLGSIIGGKLQGQYGTVLTFWFSAAFDAIFVSALILYMYVLRKDVAMSFRNPQPIQTKMANVVPRSTAAVSR